MAGGTPDQARAALHSAFLNGASTTSTTSCSAANNNLVVGTTPAIGQLTPVGSNVTLTVCDLNGHYLRFGQRGSDRSLTAGREPATDVAIVERLPTPEEHQGLVRAVGWADGDRPDRAARVLAGARFGVVAVAGGVAVGSG